MIEISSSKQYTMSSGYITLKAKRIQPEDGLKRAETCSYVTYCTTKCNKFCCVLTAGYIFCIQSKYFVHLIGLYVIYSRKSLTVFSCDVTSWPSNDSHQYQILYAFLFSFPSLIFGPRCNSKLHYSKIFKFCLCS